MPTAGAPGLKPSRKMKAQPVSKEREALHAQAHPSVLDHQLGKSFQGLGGYGTEAGLAEPEGRQPITMSNGATSSRNRGKIYKDSET